MTGTPELRTGRTADQTTVVCIDTGQFQQSPSFDGWWDGPVAEMSTLEATQAARIVYEKYKATQRPLI